MFSLPSRLATDLKAIRGEVEKVYTSMVAKQSDLVASVPSVSKPYILCFASMA